MFTGMLTLLCLVNQKKRVQSSKPRMGGACSKDFSTNKLNDKKVHPVDTQKISTRDEDKENQNEETRHNNHFIVNATLKTRMRQKSMGLFGVNQFKANRF